MKMDKVNGLFTHLCGERVTNGEVLYTAIGLMTLIFICGMVEGLLS